ncbi:MAG: exosortase [Planctomycetota bacterium]|nr:MAG: exosortase [Planctomycetota bacterium]
MSVAGASPAGEAIADRARPWWLEPGFLLWAGAALAGLVALAHHWFAAQHLKSWGSQDWAHAYLVPFISGYAVWLRRDRLARLRPEPFAPGAAIALVGVTAYILFTVGFPSHMSAGFSLVMTIFGLALLTLGPRITAELAFPLAYLVFGVSLSNFMIKGAMFQLQLIASQGAWVLLNLAGVTTDVAGNTLTIQPASGDPIPLDVAAACSGMRMVIGFYALGAAVAFFSTTQWWQRIALVLLAAPIAILVNVFRVASLGALSLWDPEFAKGNAHMMVGVVWLVPALVLFMGCVWLLKRLVRDIGGAS